MILSLSEEQRELALGVRRFLAETSPPGEVRRAMETEAGYDASLWKRMAEELGLQSVAIPEERGGQGLGLAEVALVAREMGRALVCAPYLSTVALAGSVVAGAADAPLRAELEGAIASGEVLALATPADRAETPLRARRASDGWRIDGLAPHVVDGHVAARVVAIARVEAAGAEDALGAFVVDAAARGLERSLRRTFDRTRRIASLAFDGVAATPLATPGADGPALERALDVATSILAAEMLGGSEHVLEASVAWARERRQFGRAIGSFQAVKHKAADVWIALEASRSLVDRAVECAALDEPGLALDASAAKAFLSEAYPHAARENVQIHGGIGFTWEHDAHLYLRRATSTATLLGDARWHRARVAALALAR